MVRLLASGIIGLIVGAVLAATLSVWQLERRLEGIQFLKDLQDIAWEEAELNQAYVDPDVDARIKAHALQHFTQFLGHYDGVTYDDRLIKRVAGTAYGRLARIQELLGDEDAAALSAATAMRMLGVAGAPVTSEEEMRAYVGETYSSGSCSVMRRAFRA